NRGLILPDFIPKGRIELAETYLKHRGDLPGDVSPVDFDLVSPVFPFDFAQYEELGIDPCDDIQIKMVNVKARCSSIDPISLKVGIEQIGEAMEFGESFRTSIADSSKARSHFLPHRRGADHCQK